MSQFPDSTGCVRGRVFGCLASAPHALVHQYGELRPGWPRNLVASRQVVLLRVGAVAGCEEQEQQQWQPCELHLTVEELRLAAPRGACVRVRRQETESHGVQRQRAPPAVRAVLQVLGCNSDNLHHRVCVLLFRKRFCLVFSLSVCEKGKELVFTADYPSPALPWLLVL